MRVALLQQLDALLMTTATGLPEAEVSRLAAEGERCGLLARAQESQAMPRGIHPLVRQFLVHRLERELGADGVRDLHLAIAGAHFDRWTIACHHFAAAGATAQLHECLEANIRAVLGTGPIATAAAYIRDHPPSRTTAHLAIVQSRAAFGANRVEDALQHATSAFELEPSPVAAQNLIWIHIAAGDLTVVEQMASLELDDSDPLAADIVRASRAILSAGSYGTISDLSPTLAAMAARQKELGLTRYFGITMFNLGILYKAQGDAQRCLAVALEAEQALVATSSDYELTSVRLLIAWARAHLESLDVALRQFDVDRSPLTREAQAEVVADLGSLHVWYGSRAQAAELLASAPVPGLRADYLDTISLVRAELALRDGNIDAAREAMESLSQGPSTESGHLAHRLAILARMAIARGDADSDVVSATAMTHAEDQGAWHWWRYTALARALASAETGQEVQLPPDVRSSSGYLSMLAEPVAKELHRLAADDLALVREEALRRQPRWREALRPVVREGESSASWPAAYLLEEIGDETDVSLLRAVSHRGRAAAGHRTLGRRLARRLAKRLYVEDQGRVRLALDGRQIDGSTIRRKVLALLCFLLTRPAFSATRDEVLEALWPDLEPAVAGNSLNQTVYFLRRVIEPHYSEDTTAGYVHFETNVIWLDQELVHSRSTECWRLIRELSDDTTGDDVSRLSERYEDRFALDFAYEEWAIPYRDALHAAYLHVIESAVSEDIRAGRFDRAVVLCRSALVVDPAAENLEVLLVRVYRLSGAHAAAAEQYAHYASLVREQLGVEPPPIHTL
jgi:DNA-binding SARP family transcriptional activator